MIRDPVSWMTVLWKYIKKIVSHILHIVLNYSKSQIKSNSLRETKRMVSTAWWSVMCFFNCLTSELRNLKQGPSSSPPPPILENIWSKLSEICYKNLLPEPPQLCLLGDRSHIHLKALQEIRQSLINMSITAPKSPVVKAHDLTKCFAWCKKSYLDYVHHVLSSERPTWNDWSVNL